MTRTPALKHEHATAKKPRVRKPKRKMVQQTLFVATFHENERAHIKCTCHFPDGCDGSRLIACTGCTEAPDCGEPEIPGCKCAACHFAGVTGCQGCPNCLAVECAGCGKRDASIAAVDGEQWTCSPECTRKMFAVAPC